MHIIKKKFQKKKYFYFVKLDRIELKYKLEKNKMIKSKKIFQSWASKIDQFLKFLLKIAN
jgi:hypothetical protein